jgi:hypothetical protein
MTARHQRPRLRTEGAAGIVPDDRDRNHGHSKICAITTPQPEAGPAVPIRDRLLWGWPEIISVLGIPRRTLTVELAAGRFPQPARRVGRRPYWDPEAITRWARGGRS